MLSGVNRGNNAAENAVYSGTVGAAMEAALQGVPAVALSQYYGPENRDLDDTFEAARAHGLPTLQRLLDRGVWTRDDYGIFYNINFPPVPAAQVKGLRAARQGFRRDMGFRRAAARGPLGAAVPVGHRRAAAHAHQPRLGRGCEPSGLYLGHADARGPHGA